MNQWNTERNHLSNNLGYVYVSVVQMNNKFERFLAHPKPEIMKKHFGYFEYKIRLINSSVCDKFILLYWAGFIQKTAEIFEIYLAKC